MKIREGNILLIILAVVGIMTASVEGYFWWSSQRPKTEPATAVDTKPKEASSSTDEVVYTEATRSANWKTFTNKQLGITFNYPASWGDPREEFINAKTTNTSDAGQSYRLTFTKNPEIYAVGESTDFSAGRGATWYDFRGDPTKSTGVYHEIYVGIPGCVDRSWGKLFYGNIDFNMPGKKFDGIRLLLPILSTSDQEKYGTYYTDLAECEYKSSQYFSAINKAQEITKKIESGNVDSESRKNLETYKTIAGSSKVL